MEESKDLVNSPTAITAEVIAELNKPSASEKSSEVDLNSPTAEVIALEKLALEDNTITDGEAVVDNTPIEEVNNLMHLEGIATVQQEAVVDDGEALEQRTQNQEEERVHQEEEIENQEEATDLEKKTDNYPQPLESTGEIANVQAPKNNTAKENPSVEKEKTILLEGNNIDEQENNPITEEAIDMADEWVAGLVEAAIVEAVAEDVEEAVPFDVQLPPTKFPTKARTRKTGKQAKKKLDFSGKEKGEKEANPRKNPPTQPQKKHWSNQEE